MSSPSRPPSAPIDRSPVATGERRGRLRVDPRRIVVVVAVAVLALGSGASALMWAQTDHTRDEAQYLLASIGPPREHLLAAERATDLGQGELVAAVSSTGEDRSRHLSQAIAASRDISSEWAK